MKLGFIGLGKMGSRMALKLLSDNHEVVVWNRSKEPIQVLQEKMPKVEIAQTVKSLIFSLPEPRIVWCMLPAGDITEQMLAEIASYVTPDDIVIDGGNAHFKDTQMRYEAFQKKGIRFLGIGVSGGIIAEKTGYPLMVGGDKSAYESIAPLLKSLAKPTGGFAYFGTGGAGHFVKMVHNAIEYGMMQALGEGFGILEKAPYDFDMVSVGNVWQKGSIVSSFLLDRAVDALTKDSQLTNTAGVINASGEAEWAIQQAKEEKVAVAVIEASLVFRQKSHIEKDVQHSFAAKMVAALRHEFGGHSVQ